jgi:hypothetical protein
LISFFIVVGISCSLKRIHWNERNWKREEEENDS